MRREGIDWPSSTTKSIEESQPQSYRRCGSTAFLLAVRGISWQGPPRGCRLEWSLRRRCSNRQIAAAAATLSDSIAGSIGIRSRRCASAAVVAARPAPSAPSSHTVGSVPHVVAYSDSVACASAARRSAANRCGQSINGHVFVERQGEVRAHGRAQHPGCPQERGPSRGRHMLHAGGRRGTQQRSGIARVLHTIEENGVRGEPARQDAMRDGDFNENAGSVLDRRNRVVQPGRKVDDSAP